MRSTDPRGQVVWKIDDKILYVAAGLTGLPEEVHLGFGVFTLVPIGEGEGSCHGQGARVLAQLRIQPARIKPP